MDPLSETQLRILREAATPEGCRKYRAPSARRLRSLRFVEDRIVRPAGGLLESRLFATDRGRRYLLEQTWSPHERAAVDLFAQQGRCAPDEITVVRSPEDGVWYDWADPVTGNVGQCFMERHHWEQAPLGEAPVVLAWSRPR